MDHQNQQVIAESRRQPDSQTTVGGSTVRRLIRKIVRHMHTRAVRPLNMNGQSTIPPRTGSGEAEELELEIEEDVVVVSATLSSSWTPLRRRCDSASSRSSSDDSDDNSSRSGSDDGEQGPTGGGRRREVQQLTSDIVSIISLSPYNRGGI